MGFVGKFVAPINNRTQVNALIIISSHWRLMTKISNVVIANAIHAPRAKVPNIIKIKDKLTRANNNQLVTEFCLFRAHNANIIGKKKEERRIFPYELTDFLL